MKKLLACLAVAAAATSPGDEPAKGKVTHDRLAAPVTILDGKDPIDVDVGHATPFVVGWDNDGKKDLLVGQYGGGKLRIYLNRGTDAQPRFEGFTYLQAGGKDANVPVD